MVSFCRIADAEIRSREPVSTPDALLVLDAHLVHQVDLFAGLRPEGYILLNSARTFDALGLGDLVARFRHDRMLTVPATELALAHTGRPVPNVVLLGGLAAISGIVSIESVVDALGSRFAPAVADANAAAAREAYAHVRHEEEELEDARPA